MTYREILFWSLCEPLLDGFAIPCHSPLATLAFHTVSIWLRSTTNEGQFSYKTYRLLAYICVSILVIFMKISFGAQTGISLLIYEWEEWELVSELVLHLKEYYGSGKKKISYITTWYLFKKVKTICLPNPCIACKNSVGTSHKAPWTTPTNYFVKEKSAAGRYLITD